MNNKNLSPKDHKENYHEENAWQDIDDRDMNSSEKKSKKIFYFLLFSISAFIVMLVFATVNYYFKNNYISSDNIIYSNTLSSDYESGKNNNTTFSIKNINKTNIKNVILKIEYEKGIKYSGEYNIEKKEFNFGNILPGQEISTDTIIAFLGKEGDIRNIASSLIYSIDNGNTFEKKLNNKINISSALVSVNLLTPDYRDGVIAGSPVDIDIIIKNNTKEDWENGVMDIIAPYGFVVSDFKQIKNQTLNSLNEFDINNFASNTDSQMSAGGKGEKYDLKNIKLPKIDKTDSIRYKLSGYFDGKKYGENIFRFSISNNDSNGETSLIASDIYTVNTIAPLFTYNFKYEENGIKPRELIAGKVYDVFMIIKNSSDYAYDNIDVNLLANNSNFDYNIKTNADLIRINPQEERELHFILTAGQNNQYKIQINGYKKGDSFKKVLTTEYYNLNIDEYNQNR